MNFYGQKRILLELGYLIPEMRAGANYNLLFRAPSGCGKTKLAIGIANLIDDNSSTISLPDDSGRIDLDLTYRIQIVDEIHTLKQPELLYPLMDSKRFVFLLCSNEFGELKEPLVNRCFSFDFDLYSKEEIIAILNDSFEKVDQKIERHILEIIADNCNLTPRIAKNISDRLIIIFRRNGIPTKEEDIRNILQNILQINDGLNPLHQRYLDYLQRVKRASLDSISFGTRIDRKTIQREIEPVLVEKQLVEITSRGRILI